MNHKNLEVLNEISKVVNSILDYSAVLQKVMDLALETVSAERGAIILKTGAGGSEPRGKMKEVGEPIGGEEGVEEDEMEFAVARDISRDNLKALADLSSSVVRRVLNEGKPILLHDVQDDQRFRKAKSVVEHNIRSVLCVPLISRGRLSGAIYVDTRSSRGVFTSRELEFLAAFSDQAAIAIENAKLHNMLSTENAHLKQELLADHHFSNVIGRSKEMLKVFDLVKKMCGSNMPVLISGETGTGKEQVARALHYNGPRKNERFVPIYCGSLPTALMESELFGYKKGAFTGANQDKRGFFDEANRGTLFLDEITDIGPEVQAKLLRFIQEREFFRIGDTAPRKVETRVISATNRNIEAEVKAGRFREDLFYRLNVVRIELPPLRKRKDDIPLLADHFLRKSAREAAKELKGFAPETVSVMQAYDWPGNVRELENVVARAVALSSGGRITPDLLGFGESVTAGKDLPGVDKSFKKAMNDFESEYIKAVLKECKGNRRCAARKMGVSLRNLQYRLRKIKYEEET
jgi:Nif-specific regulatory protein